MPATQSTSPSATQACPHARPHTTTSDPTPPHTAPNPATRHHTVAPAACGSVCSLSSVPRSHADEGAHDSEVARVSRAGEGRARARPGVAHVCAGLEQRRHDSELQAAGARRARQRRGEVVLAEGVRFAAL